MEGASFDRKPEASEKNRNEDLVMEAFANLPEAALEARNRVFAPAPLAYEEFLHRVREFNNLDAKTRGKRDFDPTLTLDKREQGNGERDVTVPAGYPLTIFLEKDGSVAFSARKEP